MGQGGSESVNDVTNITRTMMDIDSSIKQNIQEDCISQDTQKNVINIINSKVRNATVAQKNQLENLCSLQASFKNNVNTDIQNKVAAAIAETAKSQGGSLGGGNSVSKNIVKVMNDSSTFVNASQVLTAIKRCINNIDQSNIINIINSDVDSGNYNQVNDAFKKCLMSFDATNDLVTKATSETKSDVKTEAESKGGDPMASSATSGIISVIIVVILISSLVPVLLPSDGGSGMPSMPSAPAAPSIQPNIGFQEYLNKTSNLASSLAKSVK